MDRARPRMPTCPIHEDIEGNIVPGGVFYYFLGLRIKKDAG